MVGLIFQERPYHMHLRWFSLIYLFFKPPPRLPASETGMIVDKGVDFPQEIDDALKSYGEDMWLFRNRPGAGTTTRALNRYTGDNRGCALARRILPVSLGADTSPPPSQRFQYLTPRVRITPRDLTGTPLFRPATFHFICSPTRAAVIMSEVAEVEGWAPLTIYEPIPVRSRASSRGLCRWVLSRRSG
jgi:hypothetical protein